MKRAIAAVLCLLVLVGCADDMEIDGVKYRPYGLLSQERRSCDVEYELVWGNIIWAALLVETIIAPIYFFGWSVYEPVGRSDGSVFAGVCRR